MHWLLVHFHPDCWKACLLPHVFNFLCQSPAYLDPRFESRFLLLSMPSSESRINLSPVTVHVSPARRHWKFPFFSRQKVTESKSNWIVAVHIIDAFIVVMSSQFLANTVQRRCSSRLHHNNRQQLLTLKNKLLRSDQQEEFQRLVDDDPTSSSVNLQGPDLNDDDLIAFSNAMIGNNAIKSIDLFYDHTLTDKGMIHFVENLHDNNSIKELNFNFCLRRVGIGGFT